MKYRITLTIRTNVPPDDTLPVSTPAEMENFWNGLQVKMLQENGVEVIDVGIGPLDESASILGDK